MQEPLLSPFPGGGAGAASGRWAHPGGRIARRAHAWDGGAAHATTRTPRAGVETTSARETRGREKRAVPLHGANFSNCAAKRSAGLPPLPRGKSADGRHSSPRLTPGSPGRPLRERRAILRVTPRATRLPQTPGRQASVCSPPYSPAALSVG